MDGPILVTGGAGDVRHAFASKRRAADLLGFRAWQDFDAGMREFASLPPRE
jgi:hypothetical protein